VSPETRQVRAYNVRVGDELSFFDAKARRGRIMVVSGFEDRTVTDTIVLTMVLKGARRKQRYLLSFKRYQLVRVRRLEANP